MNEPSQKKPLSARIKASVFPLAASLIAISMVVGFFYPNWKEYVPVVITICIGLIVFLAFALAFKVGGRKCGILLLLSIAGFICITPMYFSGPMSEQEKELAIKKLELEEKLRGKEGWVYAVNDIPKGSLILEKDIEIKEAGQTNLPDVLISRKYEVGGLKAKRNIQTGRLLTKEDVGIPIEKRLK